MMDQANRARGGAEAIISRARATTEGLSVVSQTLKENGGSEAASLRIAEQYIHTFGNVAKEVVWFVAGYGCGGLMNVVEEMDGGLLS
ncbi:hypothetical protein RYX36_000718 [Vicia faba]